MKLAKKTNGRRVSPSFRSILDDFWGPDFFEPRWVRTPFINTPAVNIKDNEGDFIVEVAAPGLTKDDFKVSIENNILSISCEKEEKKEEKDENYTREEFNYSAFSRSFSLPENIDTDSVEAMYREGVLTLTLKKLEIETPTSKTIAIK